jgi:hypothetical protein
MYWYLSFRLDNIKVFCNHILFIKVIPRRKLIFYVLFKLDATQQRIKIYNSAQLKDKSDIYYIF